MIKPHRALDLSNLYDLRTLSKKNLNYVLQVCIEFHKKIRDDKQTHILLFDGE